MCWGCTEGDFEEAGLDFDLAAARAQVSADPALSRVAADIALLYQIPSCGCGGPLHITTDDNNVEDGSLTFCEEMVLGTHDYGSWPGKPSTWHLEASQADKDLALRILAALRPMPLHVRSLVCALGSGAGYDLQYGRGFQGEDSVVIAAYAAEFTDLHGC